MTITANAYESDLPPFDIRACPIWAIPQIAHIRDQLGATILSFTDYEKEGDAVLLVDIPGHGRYIGLIYRSNMNNPHVPNLYYNGKAKG